MSDTPKTTPPDNIVPLMEDPFIGYWNDHPIHKTAIAPEVVSQFKDFAVDVWNAARYDMACRYSDLLLSVLTTREGESRHDAAKRMIETCEAVNAVEKSRHARLAKE